VQSPEHQRGISESELDAEFVRIAPRLTSYLFRISASRADADDLTQETWLRARRSLGGFRGGSTLKTWIFSIATNLARDNFRARRRWTEDVQDRCRETTKASDEKVERMVAIVRDSQVERYELREHIDYCFTCIAKTLEIEQQVAILLKELYGFTVDEIVEITALSLGKVKHALADGRSIMSEIFDRRCALVNRTGPCHQCSEINGFVNPKRDAREEALRTGLASAADEGAGAGRRCTSTC
jgi:RNA polymerase sigma-70 factor (ECF subfamily)